MAAKGLEDADQPASSSTAVAVTTSAAASGPADQSSITQCHAAPGA